MFELEHKLSSEYGKLRENEMNRRGKGGGKPE